MLTGRLCRQPCEISSCACTTTLIRYWQSTVSIIKYLFRRYINYGELISFNVTCYKSTDVHRIITGVSKEYGKGCTNITGLLKAKRFEGCIEMVSKLWLWHISTTSSWYRYVVLISASGVVSGKGSQSASSRWHELSQSEQDSYKVEYQPLNEPVNIAPGSINTNSVPDANSKDAQGQNGSMANARVAVDNFMIKWQMEVSLFQFASFEESYEYWRWTMSYMQAINMAATYHGDFAMIGVSDYLGKDAYQIVRATPRALQWVEHDKLCDPKKHVAAQLQSFVTGTEAGLLNLSKLKVDGKLQYPILSKTFGLPTDMLDLHRPSKVSRSPIESDQ